MTHTYAELAVSQSTYDEVKTSLRAASYDHAFMEDGAIDMHGIGLVLDPNVQPRAAVTIEAPADPLDTPLPCDIVVGHGTTRKGVALRSIVLRMKVLYEMATGKKADEVANRTAEERRALHADFIQALQEGRTPASEPTMDPHEQRYLMRHPAALMLLMDYRDQQQDQADSMGFETTGDGERVLELKAIGAAIVRDDTEIWSDEVLQRFGVKP